MGKNQAYKSMQRARMSSHAQGTEDTEDGLMDGSFHSPEWHAARLASLQTSHTITWEEYRKRQKEEAKKKEELEDDEVRMMKEYRAQLDAERASKLSRGRNHAHKKSESKGKREKDKKRKKPERKPESDSNSEISSDGEKKNSAKRESRNKKAKKEKRHKSRRRWASSSSSSEEQAYGPIPLSSFFGGEEKV